MGMRNCDCDFVISVSSVLFLALFLGLVKDNFDG